MLPFWDNLDAPQGEDFQPNLHDQVWLGDVRLPGIVNVQVTAAMRLDRKKAGGRDGGRKTFRGVGDAKVDIIIKIWTVSQYDLLETATKRLWPGAGKNNRLDKGQTRNGTKTQTAMDIIHPEAQRYGIRSVAILSMTSLKDSTTVGMKEMIINCEEHQDRPSKKKTRTVAGSKSARVQLSPTFENARNSPSPAPSETAHTDP